MDSFDIFHVLLNNICYTSRTLTDMFLGLYWSRRVRVRSDAGLVLSRHTELIHLVFLEAGDGARGFGNILFIEDFPLFGSFFTVFDHIVEDLRATITLWWTPG